MMSPVTHSYIWNRNAAKTFFASLTKIERQEIILSIEYSIIFIAVFVDKLQNQESCMHRNSFLPHKSKTTFCCQSYDVIFAPKTVKMKNPKTYNCWECKVLLSCKVSAKTVRN